MKLFLSLLGSLLLFASAAQTHLIGVELGPTIAQTVRKDFDYYRPLNGGLVNLFYEFQQRKFTSTFGLGYINKGFQQELTYVDELGTVLGEGAIEKVRHNYFSISEIVGVEFGEKFFWFSGMGMRASVYSNTIVSSPPFLLNDGTTVEGYRWELDYLNLIDLSALARIGGGLKKANGDIFYLSVIYDMGLTNTYKSETPSKHRNLSLLIGFKRSIVTPQREKDIFGNPKAAPED